MTDTSKDMLEALAEWADTEAKLDRVWKDPDIPGPYARLAALLRALSARVEAAEALAEAVRYWPDSVRIYFKLMGADETQTGRATTHSDRSMWRQLREIEAALAAYDATKDEPGADPT